MPVYKLFKQGEINSPNAIPDPQFIATVTEIITKRIDPGLIDPDTLEKICLYSGGVLRELIRITNDCCRVCLRSVRRYPDDNTLKINQAVLEQSIRELSLDFAESIGTADEEIIKTVYEKSKPKDLKDQNFLDLLHGFRNVESRNKTLHLRT